MMRVKRNKLIVVVIGFLVLLEVSSIFLMWKSSMNKPTILDNVKLQNIKNDGNLAIMIEQEDGTYKETSGNSWPEDMMFNEEKSGCVDNNGQLIENALVYEDGIATVETGVTSNCYLYFDLIKDDVTIAISTDGESGVMPSSGSYTNSATCSSGNITWSDRYQRIEIGNLKKPVKCNVTFTKDTNKTLLRDEVESEATTIQNGYRYNGTNPDNYIWFNNEMWRIIGSIPTCLTASCGSDTTNLVKIIRKQSIGSIVYNTNASGFSATWGSNTLYKILNEYYYGALKTTNYCTSNSSGSSRICDYRYNGIKPDSYYGKMVKNVYWNTNAISSISNLTAANFYTYEIKTRTIQGYIGLMSTSDYGYAADSSFYNTVVNAYTSVAITSTNWLYGQGNESCLSNTTISYQGSLNGGTNDSVRPVVFLDPSVFIINGNGTESDPYVIGM